MARARRPVIVILLGGALFGHVSETDADEGRTLAVSENAAYRHWPFDKLVENGGATPDASANEAHVRLSGQELCDGVVGLWPLWERPWGI